MIQGRYDVSTIESLRETAQDNRIVQQDQTSRKREATGCQNATEPIGEPNQVVDLDVGFADLVPGIVKPVTTDHRYDLLCAARAIDTDVHRLPGDNARALLANLCVYF